MNWDYTSLLDASFSPGSRVWVYQASRLFTMREALEIEALLRKFGAEWKSHGNPVKGDGYLLFGQFIILMADEKATGISGCSTDSSVRMIKDIEQQFSVNMFDRTTLAFVIKDKVQLIPLSQLQYAIDNGFINIDTLYFDNLVQTKHQLETQWMVPVKDSWLMKKISVPNPIS
jgi:hypothetical protein